MVGVRRVKTKSFKMINNRSKRERKILARESWNLGCDPGDCMPIGKSFTLSVSFYTFYK